MSETPYLGQSTDLILGQEFLTWLWSKSVSGNTFTDPAGRAFTVSMEQRVVVQGGEGAALETVTTSGQMSELREARMGLATGKKVTSALLRLERNPEAWQVTVKASDFALSGIKTPKVETFDNDAPDALFLERVYLTESCLEMLDVMYKTFLVFRMGRLWPDEAARVRRWIEQDV